MNSDPLPAQRSPWATVGFTAAVCFAAALTLLALEALVWSESRGARGYMLDDLRAASVLPAEARDLWVDAEHDSSMTDGCVHFRVAPAELSEVVAASGTWLGEEPAFDAVWEERVRRVADKFGLPEERRPTGPVSAFSRFGVAWEDLVLVADSGDVWRFRFALDGIAPPVR